jgi:hypothetical protein
VHVAVVQFPFPEVTISYDVDRAMARSAREGLFPQIVEKGWPIAGAHLPFPGLGRVEKDGKGYKYTPLSE